LSLLEQHRSFASLSAPTPAPGLQEGVVRHLDVIQPNPNFFISHLIFILSRVGLFSSCSYSLLPSPDRVCRRLPLPFFPFKIILVASHAKRTPFPFRSPSRADFSAFFDTIDSISFRQVSSFPFLGTHPSQTCGSVLTVVKSLYFPRLSGPLAYDAH